jgi:hypothetical protein
LKKKSKKRKVKKERKERKKIEKEINVRKRLLQVLQEPFLLLYANSDK